MPLAGALPETIANVSTAVWLAVLDRDRDRRPPRSHDLAILNRTHARLYRVATAVDDGSTTEEMRRGRCGA